MEEIMKTTETGIACKLRYLLLSTMLLGAVGAMACTNFIVGKKASADGSVISSYKADSYGAYN